MVLAKLSEFLKSNLNQEFTQYEIVKAVNPNPTPQNFIHFLTAMAPFQLLGLVERRQILAAGHSELYYQAT